jgi:SNF2 family DNA or RNA helicase
MRDMPGCVLNLDMGCGKSKVAVDLIGNFRFQNTLLIAPLSVVDGVWANQFKTHCPVPMEICVLGNKAGSVAKKQKLAEDARSRARSRNVPCVVIINYESVWLEPFGSWALKAPWDGLVLDECHKIKAAGGKASMYCAKLGRHIERRLGLTGTLMPHSPLDVYGIYRCLEPGLFGTSQTSFKAKYAIQGGYGGYQIVGWRNQEELNEKIYSIAFRVTKDEVLDLPEVQHIRQSCVLSGKAREIYSELENEFYAQVAGGEVTATNALTKLLRLQQVTSGFIKTDEGVESQIDGSKEALLDELIEEVEPREPVVVFCRFRHDLDVVQRLAKKHDRRYAEISGRHIPGMMGLTEWQAGDADVIGVQIQAGGIGVDLSRARYCAYYSLGFSLGDYEQSLARVHRPGQTRNVIYYHFVAENTVDGKVYQALQEKRDVVEMILGWNKEQTDEGEGELALESEPTPKQWQRLD